MTDEHNDYDEDRADVIGQNGNDGLHYEDDDNDTDD